MKLWRKDGKEGRTGTAGREGRDLSPAAASPGAGTRGSAPPGPPPQIKLFSTQKENQGCNQGWPGRQVSSQTTRLHPGNMRGEPLPSPGFGRSEAGAGARGTFLLPAPLCNKNKVFYSKAPLWCCGVFFSDYFKMLFYGERRFYVGEVPFPITIN